MSFFAYVACFPCKSQAHSPATKSFFFQERSELKGLIDLLEERIGQPFPQRKPGQEELRCGTFTHEPVPHIHYPLLVYSGTQGLLGMWTRQALRKRGFSPVASSNSLRYWIKKSSEPCKVWHVFPLFFFFSRPDKISVSCSKVTMCVPRPSWADILACLPALVSCMYSMVQTRVPWMLSCPLLARSLRAMHACTRQHKISLSLSLSLSHQRSLMHKSVSVHMYIHIYIDTTHDPVCLRTLRWRAPAMLAQAHTYMYTCASTYTHTHTCVCVYIYIYIYIYICMYVCIRACTYAYAYTHTHIFKHTYTHAYAYTVHMHRQSLHT
jgi:hypothetical protein